MRFFRRNSADTAAIPEDLQPYYTAQSSGLRSWLGPILRVIILVAILALLIWGGLWLIHKLTNRSDSNKNTSTQSTAQNDTPAPKTDTNKSSTDKKTTAQKNSSGSTNTSPTPAPAPAPSPQTPTPGTPTPAPSPTPTPAPGPAPVPTAPGTTEALVNTGPGDVAALFAVITVGGALLHRFYLVRTLGK